MSPAPNGSPALQSFEHGNVVEIHNGIMFDFYPGLPHMNLVKYLYVPMFPCLPCLQQRKDLGTMLGGKVLVEHSTCMMFKIECMFVLQNMGH